MPDGRHFGLQIRLGAFILLGLGVFLAIVYLLGAEARYFERKYELTAEFTEVAGLVEGATVRLAGVQIGRVTSVDLPAEPGGKVRVTLRIARRFSDRIRKNSEARIVTQGLLGDKLVEISIGAPDAPPLKPGETLLSREPFEIGQLFATGSETLVEVKQLAQGLRTAVDRVDRIATEVEKGKGLLHALIYEEPETLRRLNAMLASTQALLAKADTGESAVSVLLSKDSARAARAMLQAMEKLGQAAEKPGSEDSLLAALLFDPEYKSVAQDLQVLARNFREVSDKLARGQGFLGGLLKEEAEGPLGQAGADFRAAMANLKAVSDRIRAGEGTVGALIEDPTVYENMVRFLEGAQRSLLLRSLIRSTITEGAAGPGAGAERK
ncbi:MAG TPA: MlaD family protein [Methylomirabilota bacterium]|nr:MlaD family protein [Methylomirabilota bacterium]